MIAIERVGGNIAPRHLGAPPRTSLLTPPARRALTERLPEAVTAAVINFLTTTLVREPHRVGKPLRGEPAGVWAARRGSYRVLHRLREDAREVIVVRIEHRRDAYRPL